MRHTKIVATLGPATAKSGVLKKLIQTGVNVARLNFSHSTHDAHAQNIALVNKLSKQLNRHIPLIADLQGPKIRVGKLHGGTVLLKRGKRVTLTTRSVVGTADIVPVDYKQLHRYVSAGMTILLSEGLITLKVLSKKERNIVCRVVYGGYLSEHKGVNVLNIRLKSFFTEKDKKDLTFAINKGVQYVALSFITCSADIEHVKTFMKKRGYHAKLIAKIEKPEAISDLEQIVKRADGVMVARGDLGIEGKLQYVPIWQKKIVREAQRQGKIVIIATQMFESMIHNPSPTRAEVTDVSNAVFDGADGLMLSGETAIGQYPVQVIRMMSDVILCTERSSLSSYYVETFSKADVSASYALSHAAIDAAKEAAVKAIVVFTLSGTTACLLSKRCPKVPIIALTPNQQVCKQMNLLWGVRPILTRMGKNIDLVVKDGMRSVVRQRILRSGDKVVVVYGSQSASGGTDTVKLAVIGK